MADSKKASTSTWQLPSSSDGSKPEESNTLELARKFLDDESVKGASAEEKRAFLKGKGLEDAQITQLLDERKESQPPASQPATESSKQVVALRSPEETKKVSPTTVSKALPAASYTPNSAAPVVPYKLDSSPPIVTYPEFLAMPERPPPLITPSRLANVLAVSGGVWALLYGVAGLAVRPMVDNLNESRSEYFDHVNGKLTRLVTKLEGTVSEVPYKNKKYKYHQQDDDNDSVSSDPTELFHRDFGTQTSPPPSISGSSIDSINDAENAVDVQARRLGAISAAVREISRMQINNAESKADLKSAFGDIQDNLDKLAYPSIHDYSPYGGLGYGAEPDDEFKRTKDAIRSVKGVLLSARSFPVVATR